MTLEKLLKYIEMLHSFKRPRQTGLVRTLPEAKTVYFGGYNQPDGSGGDEYAAGWACGLDEVAIFDEVKSIGTLYTGTKPPDLTNESGLVGYWKFNEGGGTTVTDHSGNGNHGTFAPIGTVTNLGVTAAYPTWEKVKF